MEKSFEDLTFRGSKWYLASEVDQKLEAIKDVLKLPKCESSDETPDIVLGFEEQFYLKKILGAGS